MDESKKRSLYVFIEQEPFLTVSKLGPLYEEIYRKERKAVAEIFPEDEQKLARKGGKAKFIHEHHTRIPGRAYDATIKGALKQFSDEYNIKLEDLVAGYHMFVLGLIISGKKRT